MKFLDRGGRPFAAHRLARTTRHFFDGSGRYFAEAGLNVTPGAVPALLLLLERPGSSVTEIADAIDISYPLVVRILAALERNGLVEHAHDPSDSRRRCVVLTSLGGDEAGRAHRSHSRLSAAFDQLFEEAGADLDQGVLKVDECLARRSFLQRLRDGGG